jgi:putative hydrolase of the HAD superfamily
MPKNTQIKLHEFTCLLIDLDDTIYHHTNGAWALIRERINRFMIDIMHFPEEQVPDLRQRLWRQYGTTLRGLQAEYSVNMDEYLGFVHNVPLETILSPDPVLSQLLESLPQRKVIFTNSHKPHAERVLNILGIRQHFDHIIDIYAMSPYCKPQVEAFQKALDLINENPVKCLMIDDSPVNLDTARYFKMGTICVGNQQHPTSPHINSILELKGFLTAS